MHSVDFDALRARLALHVPRRDVVVGVPQAAVALVLVGGGAGLELLLIRRSEREGDPWSGHMALPGGRRDAADAELFDTARRETLEEVGVALTRAQLLGELDDLRPLTAPARVLVRPFVFALSARPPISASGEVAEHHWVALRDLAASSGTTEVVHHGALRAMPCYRIGESVVWGMTHRILEPVVALADQSTR